MADDLLDLQPTPDARYLIAGWRRQWSDGGEISSGLPRYIIDKLQARRIGTMGPDVAKLCYPFQVPGTHDTYRPRVAYRDGLPDTNMRRENNFFDAGNGLIVFLGEEPWFRLDIYAEAFFQAVKQLGVSQTVGVEGYNGAAPPDMERSVSCIYSQSSMRPAMDKLGVRFSNYGTQSRNGPTIAMALITVAHFQHPEVEMFRLGAMAPMYPFLTSNNDPVGISRDHRSFYDIMRRINSIFDLEFDLSELRSLGEVESQELGDTLEKIGSTNPTAKELIERARNDFNYTPFEPAVELDPAIDNMLEDILRNASSSDGST